MDSLFGRRNIIIGFILLVCIIYLVKLFQLQVLSPAYKLSATENVVRKVIQYPARGLIYDRNGKLLVQNKAAYDLLVTPRELNEFDTTQLCNILDITKIELKGQINAAKRYSYYKPSILFKQISQEKYAFLQEQLHKYQGFYIQPRTLREYPHEIASHALGYIGEVTTNDIKNNSYYKPGDYTGISGFEKSYETELRGEKGVKYYLVDVHNRLKGSYENGKNDVSARVGKNITTSLDSDLQKYAEHLMQNKKGSVVAIEPSTGEVLVMLTMPDYDPNLLVGRERGRNYAHLANDELKPLYNRSLMSPYPPGSTFKIANALIGLQEGVITPDTRYYCAFGYHTRNYSMGCHHDRAFRLDGSISHSCNAYYCNVFKGILENPVYNNVRQGYDVWHRYIAGFGFGSKLNTDFINENSGFLPTSDYYEKYVFKGTRWSPLTIMSLSIGQGELGVTPLQMANYTAILANRGYYYTPHIAKRIENDGFINPDFYERNYSLIDAQHYEEVLDGMQQTHELGGTGYRSRIPGIKVCGKTGTAENPHGSDHSVYIAFAPRENPQIAIAVYVENGVEGAYYAAPIASLIMEKYLKNEITGYRLQLEKSMVEANLLNSIQPER